MGGDTKLPHRWLRRWQGCRRRHLSLSCWSQQPCGDAALERCSPGLMCVCMTNLHLEIKHSSRSRQPLVQCQQSNVGFKGEAKNVLLGASSGPCSSFIVPKWTTYWGALVIALTTVTCQTQQARSKRVASQEQIRTSDVSVLLPLHFSRPLCKQSMYNSAVRKPEF